MKIYVAESVSPANFYARDWEGRFIEEIARLLKVDTHYRIVITKKFLKRAIREAANLECEIFHLSCHGDETSIQLTSMQDLTWSEFADLFQEAKYAPQALILSSCIGGNSNVARVFENLDYRPEVIFGSEAKEDKALTFPGACVTWSILYTDLVRERARIGPIKAALDNMNAISPHKFVYRRWNDDKLKYVRYPTLVDE